MTYDINYPANPFWFLQLADEPLLAAIARGEVDLNAKAKEELAQRGLDDQARWVGVQSADSSAKEDV
jgi:hypothetical protein